MPQGKKGIADSGYKHLYEHIFIHREEYSKIMTNHINRVWAIIPRVAFLKKDFRLLSVRRWSDNTAS